MLLNLQVICYLSFSLCVKIFIYLDMYVLKVSCLKEKKLVVPNNL